VPVPAMAAVAGPRRLEESKSGVGWRGRREREVMPGEREELALRATGSTSSGRIGGMGVFRISWEYSLLRNECVPFQCKTEH
jgi:hypothetical protein